MTYSIISSFNIYDFVDHSLIDDLNKKIVLKKYGSQNEFLPSGNYWSTMDVAPYRLSFYGQDKLEFKGLIAILGLNLDVINPNHAWYDIDVYNDDFYSSNYTSDSEADFEQTNVDPQIELSPRLALSHPITETSKLYFKDN